MVFASPAARCQASCHKSAASCNQLPAAPTSHLKYQKTLVIFEYFGGGCCWLLAAGQPVASWQQQPEEVQHRIPAHTCLGFALACFGFALACGWVWLPLSLKLPKAGLKQNALAMFFENEIQATLKHLYRAG